LNIDISKVLGNFILAPIALDDTISFRAPSSDEDEKAGKRLYQMSLPLLRRPMKSRKAIMGKN